MTNEKAGQVSAGDTETAGKAPADANTTVGQSSDMQTFLGRQLRAVYDDIARQPVPDRFLELMKQLEIKTSSGS